MTLWQILFLLLLLIYILVQVADFISTLVILSRGGRELNPILRRLMLSAGAAPALVLVKMACITIGIVIYTYAPPVAAALFLAGVTAFYLVVLYRHNLGSL